VNCPINLSSSFVSAEPDVVLIFHAPWSCHPGQAENTCEMTCQDGTRFFGILQYGTDAFTWGTPPFRERKKGARHDKKSCRAPFLRLE